MRKTTLNRDATSNEANVLGATSVLPDSDHTLNKAQGVSRTRLLQSDAHKKWWNAHRKPSPRTSGESHAGKSHAGNAQLRQWFAHHSADREQSGSSFSYKRSGDERISASQFFHKIPSNIIQEEREKEKEEQEQEQEQEHLPSENEDSIDSKYHLNNGARDFQDLTYRRMYGTASVQKANLNEDAMSFQDSTYGTMSKTASIQAAISLPGVREEMLDILIKDDSLQQSGKDAIQAITAEEFVPIFKLLLRRFSRELRQEAEQKEQKAAAYAFSYYAIFAAKSACEYWMGMEESRWTEMLAQIPEKKIELDFTLQRIASSIVPEDEADDNDEIDDEWEECDPEELQHLVHLKRLENFVTSSIAFQNLRHNVQDLTTRSNDDADQTTSQCKFAFERSPLRVIQDICKKTIEHLAGTRLSWWPLAGPEDVLKANYTRVYSQPRTSLSYFNRNFYDDIPTSLAEKLFPELVAARTMAPQVRWEKLRYEAVFLEGTTLMRLLRNRTRNTALSGEYKSIVAQHKGTQDASDRNEQAKSSSSKGKGKQPIMGADVTGTGSGSTSAAPKNDRKKGPNNEQSMKPPVDGDAGDQLDDKKSVLFLSIDIEKNDSRACSVDVGTNDLTTMASLRQSYNALRGSSFWGRKCADGIRFYRFRSFLYKPERRHHIELHRDRERYPPQNDGDYDWQLGTEWQEGDPYPNNEAWYFFSHPDDCGSSTTLREMLPKRKKDEPKSGKTVYGIYIEQRHSVWQIFIPVVIVFVLTLVGTLWFIKVWLKDHPDDLQGATVPVLLAWTVVQSILSLVITLVVPRWSL